MTQDEPGVRGSGSHYRRIRDSEPRVHQKYPQIRSKLEALEGQSDATYDHVRDILALGRLFSLDLLLLSLANRAVDVIDAFSYAFDRWNVAVASSLVRLQIDNLLRAHLAAIIPDPDVLFEHLASDRRLNRLEVPPDLLRHLPNQPRRAHFTDQTLIRFAAHDHPWIEDAYRTSSSWVHHSAAHLLTTWNVEGETISGGFPQTSPHSTANFSFPWSTRWSPRRMDSMAI